jgi:hypothetical protein
MFMTAVKVTDVEALYKITLANMFCFVFDKSNDCDVEKVKTEPKEVEDKEFKEDKKRH